MGSGVGWMKGSGLGGGRWMTLVQWVQVEECGSCETTANERLSGGRRWHRWLLEVVVVTGLGGRGASGKGVGG